MAEEDLGNGISPHQQREMLKAFTKTMERQLRYSFCAIRWHRLRKRPLPPFPELFRIRDEAVRLMWVRIRRRRFKVIQGGKTGQTMKATTHRDRV